MHRYTDTHTAQRTGIFSLKNKNYVKTSFTHIYDSYFIFAGYTLFIYVFM